MKKAVSARHPFAEEEEVLRREIRRLEEREEAIREALERLAALGCRPDPFFDRLCLDELLSNAILHGNREDPLKTVTLRVFRGKGRWGFEVADQGKGFDWEARLRSLKEPLDQSLPSGRGLALVVSSGAEVHFLDGGRRVVVVRREKG